MYAKQSTAKTFIVGPILDADGAAKTDEVVASIKVTKNGTVGAPNGTSTLTHDHAGMYKYAANAGDIDTLGEVTFSLNSGTNAMAPVSFDVLPEKVYNSLVAGSDNLEVDTIQIGGSAQSATDLKDFVDTGYDPSTHKVAGVVLVDTTTTNSDMRGTDGANTTTPPTAAAIVNEWESQSQDDPTGFHVNVREWLSQAVTLSTNNKPDVNVDEWKDVPLGTTNPLPNAAPGSASGLLFAGSNAATTFATLTVSGTSNLGAILIASLTNAGTTTLGGAVTLSSTLGVAGVVTFTSGLVANITGNISGSVGSLTGHTVQTGDSYDLLKSGGTLDKILDAILAGTPGTSGTTYYASPSGTGNGSTPQAADSLEDCVAAATTAGDRVILTPGSYATTAKLTLQTGVTYRGCGIGISTITFTNNTGAATGVVEAAGNVTLEDMTLVGVTGTATTYGVQASGAMIDNVTVRRCRIATTADDVMVGFTSGTGNSRWLFEDCIFDGSWDLLTALCTTASRNHKITLRRCRFTGGGSGGKAIYVTATAGSVQIVAMDCEFPGAAGQAIYPVHITGASVVVALVGCDLTAQSAAHAKDIYAVTNAKVYTAGCQYNPANVTETGGGTLTDLTDDDLGAIYSRLGAPAGASIAADIAAVVSGDEPRYTIRINNVGIRT